MTLPVGPAEIPVQYIHCYDRWVTGNSLHFVELYCKHVFRGVEYFTLMSCGPLTVAKAIGLCQQLLGAHIPLRSDRLDFKIHFTSHPQARHYTIQENAVRRISYVFNNQQFRKDCELVSPDELVKWLKRAAWS
jgi:hypothetical protein